MIGTQLVLTFPLPIRKTIIQLNPRAEVKDTLCWKFEKWGKFTVKSIFRVIYTDKYHFALNSTTIHSKLLYTIWNPLIDPQLKLFLWKGANNILPTPTNLVSHMLNVDPHCYNCGTHHETFVHHFFHCLKPIEEGLLLACQLQLDVVILGSDCKNAINGVRKLKETSWELKTIVKFILHISSMIISFLFKFTLRNSNKLINLQDGCGTILFWTYVALM